MGGGVGEYGISHSYYTIGGGYAHIDGLIFVIDLQFNCYGDLVSIVIDKHTLALKDTPRLWARGVYANLIVNYLIVVTGHVP